MNLTVISAKTFILGVITSILDENFTYRSVTDFCENSYVIFKHMMFFDPYVCKF